ncbi:MAG: hypothetical protein JXB60_01630 [Candidatus Cloacimonetes bacterium]|nr:hypothetical protein [Candidatus Cloacimonadota bacterium]
MKAYFLLIILFFLISVLRGEEVLELNFFNYPEFDFLDMRNIVSDIQKAVADSVQQVNFFSGRILKNKVSDIYILTFLNTIPCNYACPTDYLFSITNRGLNFSLLAANINCEQIDILENTIIEADSMKIGVFSLYSPDFMVKKNIPETVRFNFDVFNVAYKNARKLAIKSDYVIMISSLSKFIDQDIVSNLPVDTVISFDYQKKDNGILPNERTHFFSILSKHRIYGKLRLIYRNGSITHHWSEHQF